MVYKTNKHLIFVLFWMWIPIVFAENGSTCVNRALSELIDKSNNFTKVAKQVGRGVIRPFHYRNTLIGQLAKGKGLKLSITKRYRIKKDKELIQDDKGRTYLVTRSPRRSYVRVWDEETNNFKFIRTDPKTNSFKLTETHTYTFEAPKGKHEKGELLGKLLKKVAGFPLTKIPQKKLNKLLKDESLREELRKGLLVGPWKPKKNLVLVNENGKEVLVVKESYPAGITVVDEVGNQISLTEKEYLSLINPINKTKENKSSENIEDGLVVYQKFKDQLAVNKDVKNLRAHVRTNAVTMTFYPTIAPIRIVSTAAESMAKHGFRSLYRMPVDIIKAEGVIAAGFIGMYYTGLNPAYQLVYHTTGIRDDEFHKKTEAKDKNGISVFVDGIPDTDDLWGYGKYYYETNFSKKMTGKIFYVRPRSLYDLKNQLIDIRREHGLIKNIEILGHGLPGQMDINGSDFNSRTVNSFLKLGGIFEKDAEIKLVSCLVGDKSFMGDFGGNLMTTLGKNMLDRGGKVYAATEVIWVPSTSFPSSEYINEKSFLEKFYKMSMFPIEAAILYGMKFDGKNDGLVREETIPPR